MAILKDFASSVFAVIELIVEWFRSRVVDWLHRMFFSWKCSKLCRHLKAEVGDDFLHVLLHGMNVAFDISPTYRQSIHGFHGTYAFVGNEVAGEWAEIKDDRLDVHEAPSPLATVDVTVKFTDAKALRAFLSAEHIDILDSVLTNSVQIEGNLNYVYRFIFLVEELNRRVHWLWRIRQCLTHLLPKSAARSS